MRQSLKVAYLLHRFPYLTETFILREMYWIRQEGIEVSIFSLLPPKHTVVHPQARELLPQTHYSPCFSWNILKALLYYLTRNPFRLLWALAKTVWQTYREPRVMLLMLLLFPKCVHFARSMEEAGIQHIHTHFVWIEGVAASAMSELLQIPYTINPHAFGLFSRDRTCVRRELELASRIITVSDYNRQFIATLAPSIMADEIEIVRYGVETERWRPLENGVAHQPIHLLSIGRGAEKKGHDCLVDACVLLTQRGLDFVCNMIVGRGQGAEALQQRILQLSVEKQAKILDPRDQDGILELYQNSDIFVLASKIAANGDRDGIPNVLIEAMACELPVVSTSVSGIPELVQDGETGLLVPPDDPARLADALERLIANPELRHLLGKQGRLKVLNEFEIRQSTAKLAQIFWQINASHRGQQHRQPMLVQER